MSDSDDSKDLSQAVNVDPSQLEDLACLEGWTDCVKAFLRRKEKNLDAALECKNLDPYSDFDFHEALKELVGLSVRIDYLISIVTDSQFTMLCMRRECARAQLRAIEDRIDEMESDEDLYGGLERKHQQIFVSNSKKKEVREKRLDVYLCKQVQNNIEKLFEEESENSNPGVTRENAFNFGKE